MTTIGDFNAKSKNWYIQDKTSFEGKTIESIDLMYRPNICIAAKFDSRIV